MALPVVSIRDAQSGAVASLLPGQGFNCFRFEVPTARGPLDLLWAEPGVEEGNRRASASGIPLLFPFPGRLQGTTLHWAGRDYALTAGDGRGNAIHGFAHELAWRVIDQQPHRITGEFQADVDCPELLKHWPGDFRIQATYEVREFGLYAVYLLENPGKHDLPCGFGTHPYFRLPLGGSRADACRVSLPVAAQWELSEMIPTGRRITLPNAPTLQAGQPFAAMHYDDVFTDLWFADEWATATITDPESQARIEVRFDDAFRECVVYTPPHREAICIEPYTCVPDAFRLKERGISAGLRVLPAGQSFEARMEIRFRSDATEVGHARPGDA